jgi:hypothetical protein
MNYVMTPPRHELHELNEPNISTVTVMDRRKNSSGLGELPVVSSGGEKWRGEVLMTGLLR